MSNKYDLESKARQLKAEINKKTREANGLLRSMEKMQQNSPDFTRKSIEFALREREIIEKQAILEEYQMKLTSMSIKKDSLVRNNNNLSSSSTPSSSSSSSSCKNSNALTEEEINRAIARVKQKISSNESVGETDTQKQKVFNSQFSLEEKYAILVTPPVVENIQTIAAAPVNHPAPVIEDSITVGLEKRIQNLSKK